MSYSLRSFISPAKGNEFCDAEMSNSEQISGFLVEREKMLNELRLNYQKYNENIAEICEYDTKIYVVEERIEGWV
jgi:hypothetical protein